MNNLPDGFSFLTNDEIENRNIIVDLRYNTNFNFVVERVDGYYANKVILTNEGKKALFEASDLFAHEGYDIVIYDTYRPKKAVNHFKRWSESQDENSDIMKDEFFPYMNREDAFDLGFIALKSAHMRGSTIDLTIIDHGKDLHEISYQERILSDGRKFLFLDDGTVDMGSHFDLFDEASYSFSNLIDEKALENRKFFIEIMEEAGFENYEKEWWHFTLKNEPFDKNDPSSYFDFDIR
jgi:D-alanyl-D-alanine dipeptidase